jgi:hypothetical protein
MSLPLGVIAVALSILCLLSAVVAPLTFLLPALSHLAQLTEDRGRLVTTLPRWSHWMMNVMPWVSIVSSVLGGYAYATCADTQRKAGLSGATIGGVAFFVWAVVKALSKSFVVTTP